jgi:NADPH:quinone reductase-like Zn-dependent oxidoreductase
LPALDRARGKKDFPLKLPAILGRDVSGVVRAVGRNIRTFKPGDRVLALAWEAYAELVAVEGSILTHVPDGHWRPNLRCGVLA